MHICGTIAHSVNGPLRPLSSERSLLFYLETGNFNQTIIQLIPDSVL